MTRSLPLATLALLALLAPFAPVASGQWAATVEAKLTDPESPFNAFGHRLAFEGDELMVGSSTGGMDPERRLHFFERQGASWPLVNTWSTALYGYYSTLDAEGDLLLLGNPHYIGSADLYRKQAGSWTFEDGLHATTPGMSQLGVSAAIAPDGSWVALGGPYTNPEGVVVLFAPVGGQWIEQDLLVPRPETNPYSFGKCVALGAGGTLLASDAATTQVHVFRALGAEAATHWAFETLLEPASIDPGSRILSVATNGRFTLIGAPDQVVGGLVGAGTVFVFERVSGAWVERAPLVAPTPTASARFGTEIDLEDSVVLVGAPGDDWSSSSAIGGTAHLFSLQWGAFRHELELEHPDSPDVGDFGAVLALEGTLAAVADPTGGPGAIPEVVVYDVMTTGLPYCTAGTSSAGCQARLGSTGAPSASASSGYALSAQSLEGGRDGLFFFGTSGRQALPWGSGTSFQCVVPPVTRTPLLAGSGTPGACDGALSVDLNALWCPTCPSASKNPGAGALVQAQLWYRDPANTSNQTTSLSDGYEFLVQP